MPLDGLAESIDAWEGESRAQLEVRFGVPRLHLFQRVGSTNDLARQLGNEGAPEGTTVIAAEQVAGRGRAGRRWVSPPGLGLWLSMVARPRELSEPATLPLLVGLRLAESLDHFVAPERVDVKWPNDLFLGERKLGGILCEGSWTGGTAAFIVIGVGINVLHGLADFPDDIRATAGSLQLAAHGASPSLLAVATRLTGALRQALGEVGGLEEAVRAAYNERHRLQGRDAVVSDPVTAQMIRRGRVVGIARDGALLLQDPGGSLNAVRAGTVRLATNTSNGDDLPNRG